MVSALAHAQLLHRAGGEDADGDLANRLERAVQAVKQAVSQCPSYDVLIPALLKYPLEVKTTACLWGVHLFNSASGQEQLCQKICFAVESGRI